MEWRNPSSPGGTVSVSVPPRPDSQSFTKFLISAGVFLAIAAFVVPGLILRDTGVLMISRSEMAELTPVAKGELEQRQATARDAGRATPFIFGIFLVGGAFLIAFGLPRLKRQEKTSERREGMEISKLHAELQPQTQRERNERLRADVEEAELAQPEAEPKSAAMAEGGQPPGEPAHAGPSHRAAQAMQQAAQAEAAVLNHLASIAPPRYELRSQVKIEGKPSLLLDALLISQVEQLPDIVVEIKFADAARPLGITRRRVADAENQLLRYLARYHRQSIGWLILFVKGELSIKRRKEIEARAADFADDLRISVVTQGDLSRLALPV